MEISQVGFEILVDGKPVREYSHAGRVFIEGRQGSEFTLRVRNNTYQRALAVVTVDGLSVMDGRVGNYNSGGYILGQLEFVNIPGWRLNNEKVARFFFAELKEAYASLMDQPTDIGVIGCAVFYEKVRRYATPAVPPSPQYLNFSFGSDLVRGRPHDTLLGSDIGTGFGQQTEHQVRRVEFDRMGSPFGVLEIYYDNQNGLEARGIIRTPSTVRPNPFPGEHDYGCSPPPGWRG